MQRKTLWQISAIAAAAALLGVAQAQSGISLMPAPADPAVEVEKADPTERDVTDQLAQPAADAAAASTTEPATETATTTGSTAPVAEAARPAAAAATNGQQVVVSTPAVPAEPLPITREQVIAEAIQGQENDLLPRGERSIPHEDKSWHWQNGMGQ